MASGTVTLEDLLAVAQVSGECWVSGEESECDSGCSGNLSHVELGVHLLIHVVSSHVHVATGSADGEFIANILRSAHGNLRSVESHLRLRRHVTNINRGYNLRWLGLLWKCHLWSVGTARRSIIAQRELSV